MATAGSARSTGATVAYWTLGTIGRLVFGLYASSGGGPAIECFSAANGLSFGTWGSALTVMALAEVVGSSAFLIPRALFGRPDARARQRATRDLRDRRAGAAERPVRDASDAVDHGPAGR